MIFHTILPALVFTNAPVFANIEFGACAPEKNSCKDCYLALKQELLKQDGNVYNLSIAFFPPNTNPPEFVKVIYNFMARGIIIESQTWFWVQQSSYFLFPPNTFQFLSLFFGKPEEYILLTECLCHNECNRVFRSRQRIPDTTNTKSKKLIIHVMSVYIFGISLNES